MIIYVHLRRLAQYILRADIPQSFENLSGGHGRIVLHSPIVVAVEVERAGAAHIEVDVIVHKVVFGYAVVERRKVFHQAGDQHSCIVVDKDTAGQPVCKVARAYGCIVFIEHAVIRAHTINVTFAGIHGHGVSAEGAVHSPAYAVVDCLALFLVLRRDKVYIIEGHLGIVASHAAHYCRASGSACGLKTYLVVALLGHYVGGNLYNSIVPIAFEHNVYRPPVHRAIVNSRLNGGCDFIRIGALLTLHGGLMDAVAAKLQRNVAGFQHLAVISHLDLRHDLGVCGVALLEIYSGAVAVDVTQLRDVGLSAEAVRVIFGAPVA